LRIIDLPERSFLGIGSRAAIKRKPGSNLAAIGEA